jgi:hypothetical protein
VLSKQQDALGCCWEPLLRLLLLLRRRGQRRVPCPSVAVWPLPLLSLLSRPHQAAHHGRAAGQWQSGGPARAPGRD